MIEGNRISFNDTSVAFASKSDTDLKKALWLFKMMGNPNLVNIGSKLANFALNIHLPIRGIIKKTIFNQFVGGETLDDCEPTIDQLGDAGVMTILDYSVEGEKSEAGFDAVKEEMFKIIEIAKTARYIPFCVIKLTGLGRFDVMKKHQAKEALSEEEKKSLDALKQRVFQICKKVDEINSRILIDGEETWIQDTIDEMTYEMMAHFNKKRTVVYNTYQLYRHDMYGNLVAAYGTAVKQGYLLGAKLVRGAYMEKESERANELGYKDPIQPNKESADHDYNEAIKFCVSKLDTVSLVVGTHNEQSCELTTEIMGDQGISREDERVYFAQLYGMSDNISFTLAALGYNVSKYVPYGPVKKVMPYLTRRAKENTSIAGQTSREFTLIKSELKRRKKQN